MAIEAAPEMRRRRLTVDEVIRMSESGIISEDERVELVDGILVEMSPEGRGHADVTAELNGLLAAAYPHPRFWVRVNTTQPLSEWDYRLPDLVVTRRAMTGEWPSADDVLLVVEVAFSSVATDRGRKAREYAGWGAATYWVVDLVRREVVVHAGPSRSGYASVTVARSGDTLDLPGCDRRLAVTEILAAA